MAMRTPPPNGRRCARAAAGSRFREAHRHKSAETKAPASGSEAIEQVKLAQNGEQTEVNVVGCGQLSYHVTRLQNPDRLVLDFAGSHLKTSEKHIASNLDPCAKFAWRSSRRKFRAW